MKGMVDASIDAVLCMSFIYYQLGSQLTHKLLIITWKDKKA